MKLTVLGNNGTCPKKDGACSSFLLETNNTKLLIDMGNGSVAKLLHICDLSEIDGIIVSHLHFDHMGDIFPYKYDIESRKYFGEKIKKIRLFIPPTPQWLYDELSTNNVFDIVYISDNLSDIFMDMQIQFCKVPHLVDSFGVRVAADSRIFAYSSDSGMSTQLEELAREADLFLCEATFLYEEARAVTHHMSALEAGEVAKKSGVKKLLLTHLSDPVRESIYCEEAKKFFKNTRVSHMLESYTI
jgi:ribonuclease BN (tRNA processing enzyme)